MPLVSTTLKKEKHLIAHRDSMREDGRPLRLDEGREKRISQSAESIAHEESSS
jgi:hypothetical protein